MKIRVILLTAMSVFVLAACSSNEVEIILPDTFFDAEDIGMIKSDIKNQVDADVKENKDGGITLTMSKAEHESWLADVTKTLDNNMKEITEEESFESILDIQYNKDYTEFNVIVDTELYEESFDQFLTFTVGLSGVMYQIFSGADIEEQKVTVKIIDHESNDVVDEFVYPEAFSEIE